MQDQKHSKKNSGTNHSQRKPQPGQNGTQAKPAGGSEDFEKKVERAVQAEKREREASAGKKAGHKKVSADKRTREREAKKRARQRALEAKRRARAERSAAKHEAKAARLEEKRKARAAKLEAKRKMNAKKKTSGASDEEKLRVREARLAEKQKKNRARLEAKKRKRELRLENRRRRRARHARFKNADKTERKRMIAEIRAERRRKRAARAEEAKQRAAEKNRAKQERRQAKREAREARRAEHGSRRGEHPIFKSARHVAMFVALCSVFAVFTGLLTFSAVHNNRQKVQMKQQLNNIYEKSFYDLVDDMNNLSVKLSKLMVSTGVDTERYLIDVVRQSDATATNLSSIPVAESSILNAMKFVNQLGDYCSFLTNKLSKGGALSDEDMANIEKLYDTNMLLYEQINNFYAKVVAGYSFTDNINQNMMDSQMNDFFNEIQNGSIEYPKLIYDGPFSESVINSEFRGLTGEEVSKETAHEKLAGYLGQMNVSSIEFESETDGRAATYNFNVGTEGGTMFAQVSKKGGHLMLLSNTRAMDNFELSVEQCIERAENFVASLGFENMKAVWSSDYEGNVYVNIIYEQDGAVIYPDMIKVKVARDNGEILGFDAMTYYMNHTDRKLPKPGMTVTKVRQKISSKIEIESERLVVVPVAGGKEKLCYEFYGSYRDMLYFIFADADTGEQVNVLRVIDSESGALVM